MLAESLAHSNKATEHATIFAFAWLLCRTVSFQRRFGNVSKFRRALLSHNEIEGNGYFCLEIIWNLNCTLNQCGAASFGFPQRQSLGVNLFHQLHRLFSWPIGVNNDICALGALFVAQLRLPSAMRLYRAAARQLTSNRFAASTSVNWFRSFNRSLSKRIGTKQKNDCWSAVPSHTWPLRAGPGPPTLRRQNWSIVLQSIRLLQPPKCNERVFNATAYRHWLACRFQFAYFLLRQLANDWPHNVGQFLHFCSILPIFFVWNCWIARAALSSAYAKHNLTQLFPVNLFAIQYVAAKCFDQFFNRTAACTAV